ncbi:hypothetical protein SAMN05660653_02798 [Desulfonatronum thiosulfatophilum]|uniref:Probable membrane transporter protein n=1 Tax=Desulfonatronum thiosulfatophilum TaxID=617002 RepID=A0A1G6EEF9_9BACT|nr:sulfite exporter TauE/SafE family protein [Desulfonatronum thiosulfatophilum]SDB55738.1 hypothetical protein SAMN05660653_02798 [Desulfonatronum thiosulfatophilum]
METLIVCSAALIAAALTLFSGFGMGTLLMPVFAIFFPVPVAVAQTAVVHLLNNIFKAAMFGRNADKRVLLRFGAPALISSFLGAWLLLSLAEASPLFSYTLGGREFHVQPAKLTIAVLMAGFAVLEVWPWFQKLSFDRRYLPFGGMLSGFFGGLSGHQGAMRSAFLIKSGLTKEVFIGTGVMLAVIVDISRMTVYAGMLASEDILSNPTTVVAATVAAFVGTFLGARLVKKVTIKFLQVIVSVMLFVVALGLGSGLL